MEQAPLNNRGWAFQEQCLAPRVLRLGKSSFFWQCSELEASGHGCMAYLNA